MDSVYAGRMGCMPASADPTVPNSFEETVPFTSEVNSLDRRPEVWSGNRPSAKSGAATLRLVLRLLGLGLFVVTRKE